MVVSGGLGPLVPIYCRPHFRDPQEGLGFRVPKDRLQILKNSHVALPSLCGGGAE